MVLGKLPVPGRPTILITVGQGPIALAVGAGGGGLDIFTLIYPFSSFSLSLGDGPIQTEILSQRAVKPKTTNQPIVVCICMYSILNKILFTLILAMHLIGTNRCIRGAIKDHYGPLVCKRYVLKFQVGDRAWVVRLYGEIIPEL